MSGGSYNYLCYVHEARDLVDRDGDLDDMSKRLAGLGYAPDAARETEDLLLLMRQWRNRVEARMDRLREVWKAVEWWDSADWSEDQLREALKTYRGET